MVIFSEPNKLRISVLTPDDGDAGPLNSTDDRLACLPIAEHPLNMMDPRRSLMAFENSARTPVAGYARSESPGIVISPRHQSKIDLVLPSSNFSRQLAFSPKSLR